MTELKLYQLQKLIEKIDGLERFLKRTFNKKNQLRMCTTTLFVDDAIGDFEICMECAKCCSLNQLIEFFNFGKGSG